MDLSDEEELSNSNMVMSSIDERESFLEPHDRIEEKTKRTNYTTYEDALWACHWGRFNLKVLLLCGWAVSSDAIEVLSVSFLLPNAECDLEMTSSDKGWLNSMVFFGMLIGGYVWGALSDLKGRRDVLILSLLVNGFGNLMSSVSKVYWLFLLCRFVSGIGVGGSMPVIFTYFTEFQHKSWRGSMISLLATFWMAGNIIAAGLAWIVIPAENLSFETTDFTFNSWRLYIALCTVPSLSSAIFFVLMPESPKFLLQKRREQEAISVLTHVHKVNKSARPLTLNSLILNENDNIPSDIVGFIAADPSRYLNYFQTFKKTFKEIICGTKQLFEGKLLRTTILLIMINSTLAFGYYGLFLWFPELFNRMDKYGGSFCDIEGTNSTSTLPISSSCKAPGNNVYIQGFLTSISNLPGNILSIYLVDRVGRKSLLASSMVLSGLSVFFLWFVETHWQSILMSCLFGAISVCGFNMLDVLQTELYPTEVRSTAFGFQTACARVGAILGNLVFGELVDVNCAIPMLLVVSFLGAGGISSLGLPNTIGVDIH